MTATRTLLIGTAGLVAVFLLSANLMLVTGLFALAAFSVIVGGFILQPKGEVISFPLPAFHTAEAGNLKADGTAVAESFPQLLTFQLRTRNWWLLLLATLLCLVYCGWCINITRNILDDLLVIYLFLFGAPTIVLLATAWWKERRLLRIGNVVLGMAWRNLGGGWRYEFRLSNGEIHGGFCGRRFWTRGFADNVTPVFLSPTNPEFSKPGFDFAFHKFALIDRRHLPAQGSGDSHE